MAINGTEFICTRLPPVPAAIPMQTAQGVGVNVITIWPKITKNDCCGMFETNEKSLLS